MSGLSRALGLVCHLTQAMFLIVFFAMVVVLRASSSSSSSIHRDVRCMPHEILRANSSSITFPAFIFYRQDLPPKDLAKIHPTHHFPPPPTVTPLTNDCLKPLIINEKQEVQAMSGKEGDEGEPLSNNIWRWCIHDMMCCTKPHSLSLLKTSNTETIIIYPAIFTDANSVGSPWWSLWGWWTV